MITGLQLAVLSGGLIGLGLALVVARLLPAEPDLADALERVSSTHDRASTNAAPARTGKERLGLWGMWVLPPGVWVRTPARELALLRISVAQFYGEKLTFAGLGLLIPPGLTLLFNSLGLSLALQIPALASIGLMSFAAITDDPEPEVAAAGHDRTIINIKPEHVGAWLHPDPANLAALYAIFDDKRHPYYEHRIAA